MSGYTVGNIPPRFAPEVAKMFRRKLRALGHPSADTLNLEDTRDLKVLVLWLEDQKIRHYKIEHRARLHNLEGAEWRTTFLQYLEDLECPYSYDAQPQIAIDWLLGAAVRYVYGDNCSGRTELKCGLGWVSESLEMLGRRAVDIDPLDKTFVTGVKALSKLLHVTDHPDPSVLLESIRIVIQKKLSSDTKYGVSDNEAKASPLKFSVSAKECGFYLGDPVLNEAAKVLRLLHINELRELQTCVNEIIVAVQGITADPKTDQSLGRIGK